MRTLEQALLDHDLIVLRVIAEWLELDLTGADKAQSVKQLAAALMAVDLAEEIEGLEPEEAGALAALAVHGPSSRLSLEKAKAHVPALRAAARDVARMWKLAG